MLLFKWSNNRILGNLPAQCIIGAWFIVPQETTPCFFYVSLHDSYVITW